MRGDGVRLTFFEERDWARGLSPYRLQWFVGASLVLHLVLFIVLQFSHLLPDLAPKETSPIFVRVLDPSELARLLPGPETKVPTAPKIFPRKRREAAPRPSEKAPSRRQPAPPAVVANAERSHPEAGPLPVPQAPPPKIAPEGEAARRGGAGGQGGNSTDLPFVESGDLERLAKVFSYRDAPKEDIVTLNTDDLKYASYMHQLKRRIETILQYPESLRDRRPPVQGTAYISFTIAKDGHLEDLKLLNSSGSRELDAESLRAIREAFPFLPLPESWKRDSFPIPARVIFEVGYISIY